MSGVHPDGVRWELPVVRLMGKRDGSLGLKLCRDRLAGPRGRLAFLPGGAVQQTFVYKSDVDLGPLTHVDVFLREARSEGTAAAGAAGDLGGTSTTEEPPPTSAPPEGFFLQSVKVRKTMENGLPLRSERAVQEWVFPCFSLILEGVIRHFFCGTFLPRKVPPTQAALWEACRQEAGREREAYGWQEGPPGLPRRMAGQGVADLPADEQGFGTAGGGEVTASTAEVAAGMVSEWGLEHLEGDTESWKSIYGNQRDLNETALAVTCFEDGSLAEVRGLGENGDFGSPLSSPRTQNKAPFPSTSARPCSSGAEEGTSGRSLGGGGLLPRRPKIPDVGCADKFRWRSDAEFGRQLHAGAHPLLLQQCREVPEKLAKIPLEVLGAILPKGSTLEEEAVEGRVFLLDHTGMEACLAAQRDSGFMQARQKFTYAPACLLYQRPATKEMPGALLPLSIVLEPLNDGAPLLHPGFPERLWLLAKSFVACADAHYHFSISLYLETYVMLEPFVVATKRELPQFHPLRRLFEPYFRGFLAESARMRQALDEGGSATDLFALGTEGLRAMIREASQGWAPSQWNLPHVQASQGLEESNEDLPYRDDGSLVWGCIADFVREYLLLYYPEDDEVLSDRAVQAWYREGFLASIPSAASSAGELTPVGPVGGDGRHAPKHGVESRDFFTSLVTSLIWARTARRSAVLGGIYDYNAFVPNRPWYLAHPPPQFKERIEEGTYVGYLPSKGDTLTAAAFCAALTIPDERSPGILLSDTVVDPRALPLLKRFQENLIEIEIVLQGRNGLRKMPYPYLQPSVVGLGMEV